MYTKLRCLRCFNSSLFKNQVTNVLTEVVPFGKSSHKCMIYILMLQLLPLLIALSISHLLINMTLLLYKLTYVKKDVVDNIITLILTQA